MTTLGKYKYHIFQKIKQAVGNDDLVDDIVITYPPNPQMGDFSLACFVLAEKREKNPAEMAADLAGLLETDDIVSEIKATGPYVNFRVNAAKLAADVVSDTEEFQDKELVFEKKMGSSAMIEFSNVNTHKEYHVGHLRNLCYGDSIARLLKSSGANPVSVSYVNDFGIHAAKTLWQARRDDNWQQLEKSANKGYALGKMYAQAVAQSDSAEAKSEISELMQAIEKGEGEAYELWQKTRDWSLEYFDRIYEQMGVDFEKTYLESDFIEEGRRLVEKLIDKGVLKKSQGAVIADLEDEDLGVLVFLRADGTALYPVADLALAVKKFEDYNLAKSIYVVDERQSLYFKQLFAVLKKMGYEEEMIHLAYDFVKLPEGMMSSRSGRVVTFRDLFAELTDRLSQETSQRHEDWPEGEIEELAAKLAVAVIRFEMTKVNPKKEITFDINEAVRFDGFSGVYLLYTVARIESLLDKAEDRPKASEAIGQDFDADNEKDILLKVAKLPEVAARAARTYDPSEVNKYLFELAKLFNEYYHHTRIAKSERAGARLALAQSVQIALKSGLGLLGIKAIGKM